MDPTPASDGRCGDLKTITANDGGEAIVDGGAVAVGVRADVVGRDDHPHTRRIGKRDPATRDTARTVAGVAVHEGLQLGGCDRAAACGLFDTVSGDRQGGSVGAVLELTTLLVEGTAVDHPGGDHHQDDEGKGDHDSHGAAVVGRGGVQPPHRITPSSTKVHVPERNSGMSKVWS